MELGLNRIRTLLRALNNPQDAFHVIHVAGTNGKGSVCAYIESVLRQASLNVGRFNSPHLLEPRDSICVNGAAVSKQEYDIACAHVSRINEEHRISATLFEQLVAAALCIFRDHHLEWIVVEVGLGGLLDATNIFENTDMTIITSVGLDHVSILGGTIESIAAAKAGIMKPNCPVVIAPQDEPRALDVLVTHAKRMNAPFRLAKEAQWATADRQQQSIPNCRLDTVEGTLEYPVPLRGDYQRANSATAITALLWLHERGGIPLTTDALQAGMAATQWPGRLDYIPTPVFGGHQLPPMIIDGAHNLPAAQALRHYIDSFNPDRILWILGATAGKDVSEMLPILLRSQDTVLTVPFSQPEGMPWIHCIPPDELCKHACDIVSNAQSLDHIERALNLIPSLEPCSLVVVCGSLYLVADFYRLHDGSQNLRI